MDRRLTLLSLSAALAAAGCTASVGEPAGLPDDAGGRDAAPGDGAAGLCPDADGPRQLTAFRAGETIAIDGALDEATWQFARSVEFANPARSDNQARVLVAWDDQALYVAYQVTDQQLEVGVDTPVFRDDGGEIYLDTAHDATLAEDDDDVHFIVNIAGDIEGGSFATATLPTALGYTLEMAVPWAQAGGTAPAADQVMGLLVGNNDRDNEDSAQFDWLGIIDDGTGQYGRPNLWGDIRFATAIADGSCQ